MAERIDGGLGVVDLVLQSLIIFGVEGGERIVVTADEEGVRVDGVEEVVVGGGEEGGGIGGEVVVVAGDLDHPMEDGDDGGEGVGGGRGFEGGFLEGEGAAEVGEEEGEVVLHLAGGGRVPPEAGEEEAEGVEDVFGGGERRAEVDGGGDGGEIGVDGAEGGGLVGAVGGGGEVGDGGGPAGIDGGRAAAADAGVGVSGREKFGRDGSFRERFRLPASFHLSRSALVFLFRRRGGFLF